MSYTEFLRAKKPLAQTYGFQHTPPQQPREEIPC